MTPTAAPDEERRRDRKLTLFVRRLGRVLPYGILGFIGAAVVGGLDIDRRARIAGAASDLVAGILVVSFPLMIVFAIWAARDRRKHWPLKALNVSMMCVGLSLMLLFVMPGVAAKLSLDREMRVSFGPDYVRIDGAVGVDLPRILALGMTSDFKPTRVYLANGGGDMEGGQAAVALLRERGVDTAIIDGRCASSCAYMAILFPRRYLTREGSLGFHNIRSYGTDKNDEEAMRTLLTAKIIARGVSDTVARSLFSTRDIVYRPRAALLRERLVDGCWDDGLRRPIPCE